LNRKRRNPALIITIFVILHIATSIILGIKIGDVSRNILGDRSRVPRNVIKSPEMTRQWLENETKDSLGFWYQVFHLSQHYPVGWILTPITKKIGREITNEYVEGNFSLAQVNIRLGAIALAKTVINSLVFGFCLFAGWYLVCKTIKET